MGQGDLKLADNAASLEGRALGMEGSICAADGSLLTAKTEACLFCRCFGLPALEETIPPWEFTSVPGFHVLEAAVSAVSAGAWLL